MGSTIALRDIVRVLPVQHETMYELIRRMGLHTYVWSTGAVRDDVLYDVYVGSFGFNWRHFPSSSEDPACICMQIRSRYYPKSTYRVHNKSFLSQRRCAPNLSVIFWGDLSKELKSNGTNGVDVRLSRNRNRNPRTTSYLFLTGPGTPIRCWQWGEVVRHYLPRGMFGRSQDTLGPTKLGSRYLGSTYLATWYVAIMDDGMDSIRKIHWCTACACAKTLPQYATGPWLDDLQCWTENNLRIRNKGLGM